MISQTSWWVELISNIAWPIVVLLILSALVVSTRAQRALSTLTGRLRRVSAFSIELELTEEVATEVKEVTEASFREFRRKVTAEYDRQVAVFSLVERFQRLVREHIAPMISRGDRRLSYRATIHVPDVLFTQTLYQLLDYYPRGGGRGRTFPIRFGIVGRAWRLSTPHIDSSVSTEPADLVREWGMTFQEATGAGEGRRSFAAIPVLSQDGVRVGVVYLDSREEGLFGHANGDGDDDEPAGRLIDEMNRGVRDTGLDTALDRMTTELRKRGPAIAIHEVGE